MPWMIVKHEDKTCVHKQNADGSAGESMHCYPGIGPDAEEKCKKYMKALYANSDMAIHLSGESLDERVQAIRDGFYEAFDQMYAQPTPGCFVREVYDEYVIVQQGEELYKVNYRIDSEGKVTFDPRDKWQAVKLQYVNMMARLQQLFRWFQRGLKELAVTKSESDGDHPASHYLVVEDPEKPSTWHLRVKDSNGKLDHNLMGQAAGALGLGGKGAPHGNPYEGPGKEEAIAKLKKLYKSEGMPLPGEANQAMAFSWTELSYESDAAGGPKYIDGLAAGTFVSMTGEEVTFSADEFQTYLENTKKIIESTRTENGEIVGLPIDKDKHDHAGGAGWIVGLELDPARSIIRFLVNWTQEGIDLIKGNIRRFFSPSADPNNKVILGGSLTNWPATRLETGQILLRPVELSQSIKEIDMPKTIEEMLSDLKAGILEAVGKMKPADLQAEPPAEPDQTSPTLRELLNTPDAVEELGKKATEIAQDAIRAEKRKIHAVEFASRIVGGTQEKPFGLRVKPSELVALLLSLPEKQALAVEKILSDSLTAAIDFAEHGFDSDGFIQKPQLPAVIKPYAHQWVEAGKPIVEFFAQNPELGPAENYNLVEFIKEKE